MSGGDTTVKDAPGDDTEFEPVYHEYGPHRAGLPKLVPYFRSLWHRRVFAAEMSKATMRGDNSLTFFGQAWLILNPLLMAGVYYVLVTILRGRGDFTYFVHLCGAIFAFRMVSEAITSGSNSVVSSGKLLLNTAFPRLLIPLSAVRTSFFRFLPTIPVYLVLHAVSHGMDNSNNPWHPKMLLSLFFLFMMVLFAMGAASLMATLQVYFRDTKSFLPYFVRLWMYMSPVLWTLDDLRDKDPIFEFLAHFNPLFPMISGYTSLLQDSTIPPGYVWAMAPAWAIGVIIIGFLFFISRERDFPVRVL